MVIQLYNELTVDQQDGNTGLVSHLVTAFDTRALRDLNRKYSAISVAESARVLGMSEAEHVSMTQAIISAKGSNAKLETGPDGTSIILMPVDGVSDPVISSDIEAAERTKAAIEELTSLKGDVLIVQKRFGIDPANIVFRPVPRTDQEKLRTLWATPPSKPQFNLSTRGSVLTAEDQETEAAGSKSFHRSGLCLFRLAEDGESDDHGWLGLPPHGFWNHHH